MENQDDLESLARRYIDFCQDQVTAFATDPDLAKAVQGFLSGPFAVGSPAGLAALKAWGETMGPVMAATALAAMRGASAAMQDGAAGHGDSDQGTGDETAKDRSGSRSTGSRAAGPASDGAASSDGPLDLDGLTRRVAALEARIAALEAGSKRKRKSPGSGARGSKSGRT